MVFESLQNTDFLIPLSSQQLHEVSRIGIIFMRLVKKPFNQRRLNDLPRVTQLLSGEAGATIQLFGYESRWLFQHLSQGDQPTTILPAFRQRGATGGQGERVQNPRVLPRGLTWEWR